MSRLRIVTTITTITKITIVTTITADGMCLLLLQIGYIIVNNSKIDFVYRFREY